MKECFSVAFFSIIFIVINIRILFYKSHFMTRRRNVVTKNMKDYLVPIVVWILVLFLIVKLISWGDSATPIQKENRVWISVNLDTSSTKSLIEYQWKDSVEITEAISLFKWEKLKVKEWSLSLDIPELWDARLGKLGELKFNEDGSFTLSSWKAWINSTWNLDVKMKFAKIEMWEQSHISLDQNEVSSTIYVLSGFVTVENLAGKNTLLLPGEKISISTSQASNTELDLKIMKEDIDDMFRNSDWYVLNKWDFYTISQDDEETNTSNTGSKVISNGSRVLLFDTITDESNIASSTLTITWKYVDETINKITANDIEAKIDSTNKTFSFEKLSTNKTQNDFVFRAYDDSGDILEKKLITLYYNAGKEVTTAWKFNVINYDIDASKFTFTAPSSFPTFTTLARLITIKWLVTDKNVDKVVVNGYELKSYNKQYGSWRYHADMNYNNLKEGTNVYEVQYFDKTNKLLYTNNYTIVKKSNTPKKEVKIISDEA